MKYIFELSFQVQPPQLVQRCNGITAGLGYLEVNLIFHSNTPIGQLIGVRIVDPHWGERLKSSTAFNPNHNHVNAAPKTSKTPNPASHPHHQPAS
jgi:hypothetical protein